MASRHGSAELSLYGGHLLSYRPIGHAPVLFLSRASRFEEGHPIRGGIPICWPWFGPHPSGGALPMHGFARLLRWHLTAVEYGAEDAEIRLVLLDDERTRAWFPWPFELTLRVVLGSTLRIELTTHNTGKRPLAITQALHSYFSVRQIMDIAVRGLEKTPFQDCVTHEPHSGHDSPIMIRGEVDRVYTDTVSECVINDPGLGRQIVIGKSGSRSTVVWNPWIDKAIRMADFDNTEYLRMICIETANAGSDAVTLAPDEKRTLMQTVRADMKPKES
jgi:glucose-6-phosphate 1-epimerase